MRPGFEVVRLEPGHAAAFREIRLEALLAHPDAFGMSAAEEADQPLAWFAERLDANVVVGGRESSGALAGIVCLQALRPAKLAHKAELWGMYVRPDARGSGLATAMLDRILAIASDLVEDVRLTVASENLAAVRLYSAAGFESYGREPRGIKVRGTYHDATLMALRLERPGKTVPGSRG